MARFGFAKSPLITTHAAYFVEIPLYQLNCLNVNLTN